MQKAKRRNGRPGRIRSKKTDVGGAPAAALEPLEPRLLLSLVGVTPLANPVLGYDSSGTVAFNAASGEFDVSATPLTLQTDAVPWGVYILGGETVDIGIQLDSAGGLVGGRAGDDLVVSVGTGGYVDLNDNFQFDPGEPDGVLLTGEVLEFGFLDSGTANDQYDFVFVVTGGSLAPYYDGADLGVVLFSESSSFVGSFETNFGGGAKGDMGGTERRPRVRVGDYVWYDVDKDGVQDGDETGVEGVDVELFDADTGLSTGLVTSTGPDGDYLFEDLLPGNYYVVFDLDTIPAGYLVTAQDQGDDALDSDADTATGQTAETGFLAGGEENLTLDMGIVEEPPPELASLGDYVWWDVDRDGLQEEGEPGVPGATVTLLADVDNDGEIDDVVGTTLTADGTTHPLGFYEFTDLTPGVEYQVAFDLPTNFDGFTLRQAGTDTAIDSDAPLTDVVILAPGEHNPTLDAGVYLETQAPPVIDIEKYVKQVVTPGGEGLTPGFWKQCQHFDEWTYYTPYGSYYENVFGVDLPGFGDITFLQALWTGGGDIDALLRHSVAALLNAMHPNVDYAYTATEVILMTQGAFLEGNFEEIKDLFEYQNELEADLSDAPTPPPDPTPSDDWGDDADTPTGPVFPDGATVLFTYVVTNPGEVQLANVVVTDDNETPLDDSDDFHPTPMEDSGFNVGDTDLDGRLDVGEQWLYTYTETATPGQHTNIADVVGTPVDEDGNVIGDDVTDTDPANYYVALPELASLGDFVWHDQDVDGIQDAGEPGLEGVIVNLLNAGGGVIGSTATDATGYYEFTGLEAGTYATEVAAQNFQAGGVLADTAQVKWYTTLQDAGANDALDSDGDAVLHRTPLVTLAAGEDNPTLDFGFFRTCITLIKTGPETVTIGEEIVYEFTVINCGDVVLHGGASVYDPLINPDGDHEIWWDVVWPGEVKTFTRTYQTSFGVPDIDFDMNAAGDALPAGTVVDDEWAAFGITVTTDDPIHHPAMIFDSAIPTGGDWDLGTPNQDFGGPGIGWGGEAGRAGENSQALGNILIVSEDGDSSDPDDDAASGTLIFSFANPVSVESVDVLDIDCDESSGTIKTFDAAGALLTTSPLVKLGDNSFQVVDVGAENVSRMEVFFPSSGAVTGIDFGEGDCGELINTATAIGHPIGPDGALPNVTDTDSHTVTVICEPKAAIGDRVWLDENANGIQDAGEPGVPGVTVRLRDGSGTVIGTATTNADGYYLFDGLDAGDYAVEFDAPAGFEFTTQDAGSNDANDSDVDALGMAPGTTLDAGEVDRTWDAGLVAPPPAKASLGDFVWHDRFHDLGHTVDGIQDAGEPGIPGVVVNLLDASGTTVLASTTTDGTGYYEFADLEPGTYVVGIAAVNFQSGAVLGGTATGDWYATAQDAGDDAADSDGDTVTHRSAPVALAAGEHNPTIDFGFFQTCVDLIKTGPGEVNVGDTITYTFEVINCGDVVLHGGASVYDEMLNPCGDHEIWWGVVQPGQTRTFTRTYPTDCGDCGELVNVATVIGHPIGPDGALPNVTDTDSHTVTVVCVAPEPASLGDFVWHDKDVDGIQDAGEPGIGGVVVKLLDAGDLSVVATTTTDAAGYYEFADLEPDTYVVELAAGNFVAGAVLGEMPNGDWYATLRDAGNDAADSDGDRTTHRSGPVTLAAGEDNPTIDFGFFKACVELTKAGPAEVTTGDVISYHFTVVNCGDVVLHGGAAVYDAMLQPCGDHQIWWDVVWPGETKTFTRTYQTTDADCGELINVATAIGHPIGPDGALPNVSDTDSHTVNVLCDQGGGEGCTPGFWKQCQHLDAWVEYDQNDRFEGVFGVDASCDWTLLEALRLGGGGEQALARHAVAALLNAAHPDIDYLYTTNQVIGMVQAAYASGDFETTKDLFEAQNELGGFDLDSDSMEPGDYVQSDGLIAIDAGDYDNSVARRGNEWRYVDVPGATGAGAMGTANYGKNQNRDYRKKSPRLDYEVSFQESGVHYVWVRGIGPSGGDDSLHIGLDGKEIKRSDRISGFEADWTWSKYTMDGARATLKVKKAGNHTVNVWMREDGFILDQIILTTDPSFVPTGEGPNASLREGAANVPASADAPEAVPDVEHTLLDSAVRFNGYGDRLVIPHNDGFLLDSGTVKLSFKAANVWATQGLVSKDSWGYDDGGHLHVFVESSRVKVRLQSTSVSYWLESGPISSHTWYDVALTFGEGGMKLYINGELADTNGYAGGLGSSSGGAGNHEPIVLGANAWSSSDGQANNLKDYYCGLLDDVILVNRALSAEEIQGEQADDAEAMEGPETIVIEAEDYSTIDSVWRVRTDADASGGVYLTTGKRAGNFYSQPPADDYALTYDFEVSQGGQYQILASVQALSGNDNSFWVKVDDGEWILWDTAVTGDDWQWETVSDRDTGGERVLFDLAAGSHTLQIAMREDGTRLDQIVITNDLSLDPNAL